MGGFGAAGIGVAADLPGFGVGVAEDDDAGFGGREGLVWLWERHGAEGGEMEGVAAVGDAIGDVGPRGGEGLIEGFVRRIWKWVLG